MKKMNLGNWKNYGDKDIFELGILVRKEDESDEAYTILKIDKNYNIEDEWFFSELYVNLKDVKGWAEIERVLDVADLKKAEGVHFAIACTDYYEYSNFNLYNVLVSMEKADIIKELEKYGIVVFDDEEE